MREHTRCHELGTGRRHIRRRESTCPRYVVTVVARREARRGGETGEAALVCGQKLLFPYKAPLSRTILLEWLRKMPNRELGIAVSSAAVSSDRSKNSLRRHPRSCRFRSARRLFRSGAIVRRNCGCSFYSCPCPLYIVCDRRRSSEEKRSAREHFSSRVS